MAAHGRCTSKLKRVSNSFEFSNLGGGGIVDMYTLLPRVCCSSVMIEASEELEGDFDFQNLQFKFGH